MRAAAQPARMVYVVDDDAAVRDSLAMLFRTAGLRVETFASAIEFLQRAKLDTTACLVLDIRMPGLSGPALQAALADVGSSLPTIFITGHGDVPMAVEAMKRGAFDFLEKPFDDDRLLQQVLEALEQASRPSRAKPDPAASAERLASLTGREREVLDLVLAGKPSRQIAEELFISVKTVDFHRARIMQKLAVRSVAELFRLCFSGARS